MSDKEPWYAKLLVVPNVCLILGGLLILFGLGTLRVGDFFEFHPSEDIPQIARLVLVMAGLVLGLAGTTLHLHQAGIWQLILGKIYFGFTVLLLIGFGIAIVVRVPTEPPPIAQPPVAQPPVAQPLRAQANYWEASA